MHSLNTILIKYSEPIILDGERKERGKKGQNKTNQKREKKENIVITLRGVGARENQGTNLVFGYKFCSK